MSEVLLHVLIPTYNCGAFIGQAIDSVLRENIQGIKITVIDNASTDNTSEVVGRYASAGVEYRVNRENVGGIENHNKCLDAARGKYVKLMSADDVLLPGILQLQINALHENPSVGVVSCNCIVTDERLNPIRKASYLSGWWCGPEVVSKCLWLVGNIIGGPTNVMMRRSIIGSFRWDKRYSWTADLMFFCDLLREADYVGLEFDGYLYRRHQGTISSTVCPIQVRMKSDARFIWRFSRLKIEYLRWLYRYAREYFRSARLAALPAK